MPNNSIKCIFTWRNFTYTLVFMSTALAMLVIAFFVVFFTSLFPEQGTRPLADLYNLIPAPFASCLITFLVSDLPKLNNDELERLGNFNFNAAGSAIISRYVDKYGADNLRRYQVLKALRAHNVSELAQEKERERQYATSQREIYLEKLSNRFGMGKN